MSGNVTCVPSPGRVETVRHFHHTSKATVSNHVTQGTVQVTGWLQELLAAKPHQSSQAPPAQSARAITIIKQ